MRLLITGGSGFIGKAVIDLLTSSSDLDILALTRNREGYSTKDTVEWFNCDLSDSDTYKKRVNEFSPHTVIHLAWEGIPDFSFEKCRKNLLTSLDFCNTIFEIGSVKKLLVTGSCFEYNKLNGVCKETDLCISKDYFTWAKNTFRDFLQFECKKYDVDFFWARLFYVYGPNQRSNSLIPTIVNNLLQKQTPNFRTPKNANDFIYVDDVALSIREFIEQKMPSGIYNIGSGKSTPVMEILRMAERIILNDDKITNSLMQATMNTNKEVDFWAETQNVERIAAWKPITSMEQGLSKTIDSLK